MFAMSPVFEVFCYALCAVALFVSAALVCVHPF
jgi:hypothetical protein